MKKLLSIVLGLALLVGLAGQAEATVNKQTGTTYSFVNSDCDPSGRTVVTFNNASAVAVTLPQAGASGNFLTGCTITAINVGAGSVTITPTTSTVNGAATISIPTNAALLIYSDAPPTTTGNYWANTGNSVGGVLHVATGLGAAPALTSCGTTPAIVGTDTAGIVTMGTTATGCIITFNVPYTSAPFCVVSWIATPLASQSYVTSATAITTTQTSTTNNKLQYVCLAQAGG